MAVKFSTNVPETLTFPWGDYMSIDGHGPMLEGIVGELVCIGRGWAGFLWRGCARCGDNSLPGVCAEGDRPAAG